MSIEIIYSEFRSQDVWWWKLFTVMWFPLFGLGWDLGVCLDWGIGSLTGA